MKFISLTVYFAFSFLHGSVNGMKNEDFENYYKHMPNLTRVKRGFGAGAGGYGSVGEFGFGGGTGGAAAIAQQAANNAKAAQAAQGAASYQAAQQARATLAAQAASSAQQAQAIVSAKQAQSARISQAATAALAASFQEATSATRAAAAVYAAESAEFAAFQNARRYGGFESQQNLWAARRSLQAARENQAIQSQMAFQANLNARVLASRQQESLADLASAQSAANKAAWAASSAQATVGYDPFLL